MLSRDFHCKRANIQPEIDRFASMRWQNNRPTLGATAVLTGKVARVQ